MIIAIPEFGGEVNQHFGRSSSFAIIDIQDGHVADVKTVSTVGLEHNHSGIAGVLKEHGVNTVIAGGIGRGMIDALTAHGFTVLTGATGSIKEVAEAYARGEFVSQGTVCNHHHHHHHHHHE